MDSDYEFLRRFERDLGDVARADAGQQTAPASRPRRRARRIWIAAAAVVLALAASIGLLVENGPLGESVASGGLMAAPTAPSPTTAPRPSSWKIAGTPDEGGFVDYHTADLAQQRQQGSAQSGQPQSSLDLSKIMRDGSMSVTIADGSFDQTRTAVVKIAADADGSILSSSTAGGDSGTFTLRVPAKYFERTMLALGQLGTLDSSESHGQDVTAEYIDLKAHLKIYLSRRKVLLGLMADATTIGQTLAVQNQLDQVQLKIDQITGQVRYINNQVAESTIKLDLHEPDAAAATASDIQNPSLGRAWDRAVQGILNVLAAAVVGLGYLLPVLLILGISFLIWRSIRRRRAEVVA